MSRLAVLLLVVLSLPGCTSLSNPAVRADLFETAQRGSQSLQGSDAAFDRLQVLGERWNCRGKQGLAYTLAPWDRANRDRAAQVADATNRMLAARESVLAQRDLVDVMVNALRDVESEYDTVITMLGEDGAPAADITLAAEQRYLARRMSASLEQMSREDMSASAEAADMFSRDVSRFQYLLDAAINGNEDLGVEPSGNAEVEGSLAQIEELFTGYVAESADDVLESVVARHDAWLALGEITGQGDALLAAGAGGDEADATP